jgi:hypothetical protein
MRLRIWFLGLVLLAVAGIAGCGGGDGSSGTASSESAVERSAQFNDPSKNEPIATFGTESGEIEREAASRVLAESLAARQKAEFAKQCGTLGKRGLESVFGEKSTKAPSKCKAELEKIAQPLSRTKEIRKDTLDGEIAALRIQGTQAFALYHGNDGKDWAMPMEEEGGAWKVGGLLGIELPKTKPKEGKSGQQAAPKAESEKGPKQKEA